MIYSGGWDKIVSVFDMRTTKPVAHITGPLIYGDTLDIKNGVIVTGSY